MTEDAPFCAEESRRVGEPVLGTASKDGLRFLLVESDGAWGYDALDSSSLSDDAKARLRAAVDRVPRTRIGFVRPAGRKPSRPRLYVTGGIERGDRIFVRELESLDAIAGLELEALLHGEPDASTTVLDQPIVLVCTHGKHDRCCAKHGVALVTRLADEPGMLVLQSSHLGGHRFAAVVVTLPDRMTYGRLDANDAAGLADAIRAKRLYDPSRFRGRSGCDEPTQVVDGTIRIERGLATDAPLELVSIAKSERGAHVRMSLGDETIERIVRKRELPGALRPSSCFADPGPSYAFDLVEP